MIETWSLLENEYSEWKLTIIGDGPERNNLEQLTHDLNLHNISFVGFQRPIQYYKRASILLLTSEYEGFPLVLPECMSLGVVPIVYGSYSAVYDIISNGINGLILPFSKKGFQAEKMAEKLSLLLSDYKRMNKMSFNAIQRSKNYSLDIVYKQWKSTFKSLI